MLACGLEGILNEYPLGDPVECNVYEMTAEERDARGIRTLPEDLSAAGPARREERPRGAPWATMSSRN